MTTAPDPTRRAVLAVTAAGAGGLVLAACGGSSSGPATSAATPSSAPSTSAASGSPSPTASSPAGAVSGTPLVKLADVPVGSSVVVKGPDGGVVVSQPVAGQVLAFSARCTHAGCAVAPAGKQLVCPCHRSAFDGATGAVLRGPASQPLPAVAVAVAGDEVVATA